MEVECRENHFSERGRLVVDCGHLPATHFVFAQNAMRQLLLPGRPVFLCRLVKFIDFHHPNAQSAEAANRYVSLTLAGYRTLECRMAGCS
jgi:hypothetical protein